ncbi:MAG: DUF4139 domain-containing protein [Cyclonatronaceae bacterium]
MTTICLLLSASVQVQAQTERTEMLTIYPANVAVIQHLIDTDLEEGRNSMIVKNMPENISPAALFTVFDGRLIEVHHPATIAGRDQLIQTYMGKHIILIDVMNNRTEGILSHASPSLYVIRHTDGTYSYLQDIRQYRIVLDEYPEEVLNRAGTTLILDANSKGRQTVKLYYRTQGLAWNAEHAFLLNENEDALAISTSANVMNNTGSDYDDVRLRLIAGEIRMAGGGYMPRAEMMAMAASDGVTGSRESGFDRSETFEYYAFDTKERVSLPNGTRRQIALFNASDVMVTKTYRYQSQTYGNMIENGRVAVDFEIPNEADAGLGEPLPAGIARIYQQTEEGAELVGESAITHSQPGSVIRFSTGNAFNLRAEERMKDQRQLQGRVVERDYEVKLHNSKNEDALIELSRRLGTNEDIIRSSISFIKKDANTAIFEVDVTTNSESTVTFTVRSGN